MHGQLDWDGVVLPIDEVTWTNVLDTADRLQGLEINEDFFVTYKDDEGDVINVKNETDLLEAIRWAQEQGVPTLCLHVPFSSAESDSDESWTEIDNGSPRGEKVVAQLPELPELKDSEKRPMEPQDSPNVSDSEEEEDEPALKDTSITELEEKSTVVEVTDDALVAQTLSEQLEHCTLTAPVILDMPEVNSPEERTQEDASEEATQEDVFDGSSEVLNVTPIAEAFCGESELMTPALNIDRLIEVMCSVNDADAIEGVADKDFFINMLSVQSNIGKLVDIVRHSSVQQSIASVAQAEKANAGSAQKASTTQLIKILYQHPEILGLLNQLPDLEQVLLRVLRALKTSESKPVAPKTQAVEEPKALHANISCDGCNSDADLLGASVKAGCRNEQGEILGVRYKSVAVHDFDLCETCEITRRFQQRAGPFLKIVDPGTAPDVISYSHEVVHKNAESQPEDSSLQEVASGTKPEWKCKHWLKAFKTPNAAFHCDVCNQSQPKDTLLHGCRPCNFDVCHQCYVESNPTSAASASALSTVVPKVVSSPVPVAPAVVAPAPPQAKFVSDVTLTDGCAVRPGERLSKTWRVRNSGAEKWLPGTRICHVGGDSFGGPIEGVEVPLAGPGEAVNISVPLVMPYQPGRYTSYWRLTTPHPQSAKFGHRFWVTVNVLPSSVPVTPLPMPSAPIYRVPPPPPPSTQLPGSPAVIARPPPPPLPQIRQEPTEIRPEYVEAVEQIVGFGFTDIDKIARVINEVNGNVAEAVERLLDEPSQ